MPRLACAVVVVLGLAGVLASAQGARFVPVTDAMLQNPDPADWINWRRTLDGWGYSPLKQITTANASTLGLAWSRVVTPGVGETTPLVYKGTMYLTKPMDEKGSGGVLALDAVSGELKWEYRRALEAKPALDGRMRSLAIYKDKIYLNTPDAHIVALDARTGTVAWDVMVADYKLGYRYTSGPIVVNGRIVAGMTGCDRFKNDVCFISAHDPETGKQFWRTSTIARPGEPGGDTWGDLPLTFRAGGDAWIPGSFDPRTNLIYWSVAQAKPWARVSRGTDGDALYTNSLLAIAPDSGAIVWYHQFLPGETHDMDEVFENLLIDRAGRKSVFKMGKLGILWELDRTNGRYLGARDLGYQTIVDLNPATGKVTYRPGMIPQDGVPIDFCPGLGGVKTWRAMSYHPETRALYIPISLGCQQSIFRPVEKVEGGGGNSVRPFAGEETVKSYPHPESPNARGQLVAMDTVTGGLLWSHPTRRGPTTATLTTAGGLVFVGDGDGDFNAHDVKTGKIVFQTRLPFVGSGFPITYQAGGRQYVTFPAGSNGPGISVFALEGNAARR
jgi:alcohol dehydrogenase (cytochrome c)